MFLRKIFALPVVIGLGMAGYAVMDEFRTIRVQEVQNEDYQLVMVTDEIPGPVYLTHAGDDRLFVIEKEGRVHIIQDGEVLEEPFLDIEDFVDEGGTEEGLLGMVFDPNYGRFYVNYTSFDSTTRVERYTVSDDPALADPDSAELILEVEQPYGNHNAGQLEFGPDGYLYVGFGDGGSGGDPEGNGQNPGTLLGSMLRIDVSGDAPYEIPADNPFVDDPDARPETWAYGLRNPWRYSFDAETGDLYIADVGQNSIEEINFQPADSSGGENYGWNFYEGSSNYRNTPGDREPFVFPIHEYDHTQGCSVTGGYVYRGAELPDLVGRYFYADYCSGIIWTLHREDDEWVNEVFMEPPFQISSFGVDAEGELYVLSFSPSAVWRLQARTD